MKNLKREEYADRRKYGIDLINEMQLIHGMINSSVNRLRNEIDDYVAKRLQVLVEELPELHEVDDED